MTELIFAARHIRTAQQCDLGDRDRVAHWVAAGQLIHVGCSGLPPSDAAELTTSIMETFGLAPQSALAALGAFLYVSKQKN